MGYTVPALTFRFDADLLAHADEWIGEVDRVFPTAALARERDGRRLLTIGSIGSRLVPWGIALPLDRPLPAVGALIVLQGRELAFPGGGAPPLRLSGAGVDLAVRPGALSHRALRGQLAALPVPTPGEGSLAGGAGGRVPALVAARVAEATVTVTRSLCGPSPDDLRPPVRALLGLGPGSTPTGDDVLIGLLAAAIRFAVPGGLAPAGVDALRRELAQVPADSTTDVAREMIVHSSRGAFPEDLARFVELLGAPGRPPAAIHRAADDLSALGGSSGADMLGGVLALAGSVSAGEEKAER
ncbi:MAG: DUF2877 domain-containing protein [Myxococcota bacterium]|jgi:hypothetical protein|nr:DUF2877 domain-containing protein [Myxococcota bacterium]